MDRQLAPVRPFGFTGQTNQCPRFFQVSFSGPQRLIQPSLTAGHRQSGVPDGGGVLGFDPYYCSCTNARMHRAIN